MFIFAAIFFVLFYSSLIFGFIFKIDFLMVAYVWVFFLYSTTIFLFFLQQFYKSCKNNTESFNIPFTSFPYVNMLYNCTSFIKIKKITLDLWFYSFDQIWKKLTIFFRMFLCCIILSPFPKETYSINMCTRLLEVALTTY